MRGLAIAAAASTVLTAACGPVAAPAARPPAAAATAAPAGALLDADAGPMSDPDEYRIDHVSRDAGERIFTRTGIGDPYRTGIPYPLFLALLRAYPDLLGADPQALADKFGFIARAPDPTSDDPDLRAGLPLGMHLTTDPATGVAFVVTSCALCHAGELRYDLGGAHVDQVVIGLASKRARVHDYDAALVDAARRRDFDGARLAPLAADAAQARGAAWPLDWREPLTRATVDALRARAAARARALYRLRHGPPGRVAVIESFALALGALLHRKIETAPVVGWSKIPDVIGFADRTTLSWDAGGEGPMDVLVVEADVAVGARPSWFWKHPLQGASLGAYLRQPRRDLPFPGPIDRALAARGRALFDDNCARCHGEYGDDGRVRRYDDDVIDAAIVGTDPARAAAATDDFLAAANDPALTRGLTRARRTGGYVPPVLTTVWARAPYGHAGQWPSLAVLATPPPDRVARWSGWIFDARRYDLADVGLARRAAGDGDGVLGPDDEIVRSDPGLGAGGHPFLSDLGADAPAVIEYLKTL